jgi:hypothetical protein
VPSPRAIAWISVSGGSPAEPVSRYSNPGAPRRRVARPLGVAVARQQIVHLTLSEAFERLACGEVEAEGAEIFAADPQRGVFGEGEREDAIRDRCDAERRHGLEADAVEAHEAARRSDPEIPGRVLHDGVDRVLRQAVRQRVASDGVRRLRRRRRRARGGERERDCGDVTTNHPRHPHGIREANPLVEDPSLHRGRRRRRRRRRVRHRSRHAGSSRWSRPFDPGRIREHSGFAGETQEAEGE